MTGHSQGKKGVNIEKSKYTAVRDEIINCLKGDNLSYTELARCRSWQV